MFSTSPPASVHARPVATPTRERFSICESRYLRHARAGRPAWPRVTWNGFAFAVDAFLRATLRQTAAISRSRFRTPASRVYWLMIARIVLSPILQIPRLQPVGLRLLGQQELLRDLDLLELEIPGEADDLHPVDQRGRNRVERVAGGDEHDLREIEVDLEVVIVERVVLLGVEHLEKRRRRVAAEVHAELVDLVEQEDGVPRAGPLHSLDDPAGQRADVGPAVARGSPPRRGRRPGTSGRTCDPSRARSTSRARSSPRPAGRRSRESGP